MSVGRDNESAAEKRLRWRCRRGTREMDLVLERFLDAAAGDGGLDAGTRETLERLLDHPDQHIMDWLTGRASPPDAALAELVPRIRAASPGAPPAGEGQ